MRDGRRFGKLTWKENTFFRKQRIGKRPLTLKEANERLHRNLPNTDILIYRGTKNKALIHCKDCDKTFETEGCIKTYMYGNNGKECESCKKIRFDNKYSKALEQHEGLEYRGYVRKNNNTFVEYYCYKCKNLNITLASNVVRKFSGCSKCKEQEIIDKYRDMLAVYNCVYIDRYMDGRTSVLKYKCNICGKTGNIGVSNLTTSPSGSICNVCNSMELFDIYYKPLIQKLNTYGSLNLNSKTYGYGLDFIHLFCGGSRELTHRYVLASSSSNYIAPVCIKCKAKISISKPKDHNKHLVQEKLIMLKNIQSFKNAWIRQVPDAIQQLPEGFAKIVLTHIDGWINNYEEIVAKYPNGDLGTVIENNPLYKQVEDTFYPIMKKYGFKIEGE